MKLSEEQIQAAANINLTDYCVAQGIPLVYFKDATYHHADMESLEITANRWKRFSGKTGKLGRYSYGNAIHFLMEYEEQTFGEAVQRLLEFGGSALAEQRQSVGALLKDAALKDEQQRMIVKKAQQAKKAAVQNETAQNQEPPVEKSEKASQKGGLELPQKNSDNNKAFAYLNEACNVDADIINEILKRKLLYEDTNGNCVFVGYDKKSNAIYAYKNGAAANNSYTGDVRGSKVIYGWKFENDSAEILRVFKNPIMALSFMTLKKQASENWRDASYLAISSTSSQAVFLHLKNNIRVHNVELCLEGEVAESIKKDVEKTLDCRIIMSEIT